VEQGWKYKIDEIFYSLQGEGLHSGMPAIFIRFYGCNLKCHFCDTPQNNFKILTNYEILEICKKFPSKNVIITGGEPTLQNLSPIVYQLKSEGYWLAIETNGSFIVNDNFDWITVSPKKYDFPQKTGNELKVLFPTFDYKLMSKSTKLDYYFIQPISNEHYKNAIEISKKIGWRL